ncbi:MAG: T9SS type A sorting domain-containing protein [Fibromonadaceae bacterium]|jgi:endo-1,4-beta-D-glucanase Y|nr:T9SS type A sorting domain-containing protein [Fibromonadaceae bacterium]
MLKKASLCLALCLSLGFAQTTVNYPYPQRKLYGNSTINATSSIASANLKSKFLNFLQDFYEEGTCGSTPCARIKFDEPENTVSEGIAYGMIMMVYFSDNTKSYKNEFDRLWAYYKHFSNTRGVMNWKINGFNNVIGQNGATDAEFDAAFALVMAHYQFGGQSYLDDATTLVAAIRQHEMETDGLHKPGDAWNADKNPSYVSPAAFELFKDLGTGQSEFWNSAITRNYTFLIANQNHNTNTTGLPSGWAESNGNPKVCTNNCGINTIGYDPDAVRAPWRWAWSNAWYGHTSAKTLLNNLAPWVNAREPGTIKGPITLTGTMGTDANSSYIGSLMCALTVNSTYQSRLNSYWSTLIGLAGESYYNQAMQVLTGLFVTGNMPNLKACGTSAGCGTNMTSGGGFNGDYTSIDKFEFSENEDEDDRGYAATWESWYAYTDVGANGKSTITNEKFIAKDENNNCEDIEGYHVVMKDGNYWVAKIPSYNLDKGCTGIGTACQGGNQYAPFVALGLSARNNGTDYDLSLCEDGFSYQYKGQSHNFKVQTTTITQEGSDHFTAIITSSTEWAEVQVPFSDLAQPTWTGAAGMVPFDATKIYAFAWELKGADDGVGTGISAYTGELAIKDFRCLGEMPLPATRTPPKCGDGTPIANPKKLASQGGNLFFANSSLNLELASNTVVQIFDLRGNRVLTMNLTSGSHAVSLDNLPKGVYFAVAKSASWKQSIRIVK